MMISDHVQGVLDHKRVVAQLMGRIATELQERAIVHDDSKFSPKELESFEEVTPLLKTLTYGSEEYRATLRRIKPAITHHYAVNRHHPEYHPNGINDMTLTDLIEMTCDWIAATQRVKDGNIYTSLPINQERFAIDDQLAGILRQTIDSIVKHE